MTAYHTTTNWETGTTNVPGDLADAAHQAHLRLIETLDRRLRAPGHPAPKEAK